MKDLNMDEEIIQLKKDLDDPTVVDSLSVEELDAKKARLVELQETP